MLHSLIIMTGSGLTVFEKTWVEMKQSEKGSSLYGALITGVQEFARQATGLVVSYIEFGSIALSVEVDSRSKLLCTLFYDIDDGAQLGKIIAGSILRSFLATFSGQDWSRVANVSVFSTFGGKLYDAITSSVLTILQQLQGIRGINNSLVVFDDPGVPAVTPIQEEDQLGIVANLGPLLTVSTDLMAERHDRPKYISVEMGGKMVNIIKVTNACLVLLCRKNVNPSVYGPAIDKATLLLERVFALSKNFAKG